MTKVIMTMLWRWRSKAQDDDGHIMSHILIACDVYLIMLLILLSTAVAVMPGMGLYLLHVEARLKDISPYWNDRKFGTFAHLM